MQVVCHAPAPAVYRPAHNADGYHSVTTSSRYLPGVYISRHVSAFRLVSQYPRRPCLCWGGQTGLRVGVHRQGSVLGWTDRVLCWGRQTGLRVGVDWQLELYVGVDWQLGYLCWGGLAGLQVMG